MNPQPPQVVLTGGDPTIEEEEDTSRGDLLDQVSPREVVVARYCNHHEWMEEVLGSAYSIQQITPVDLGLGLAGELEVVTRGLLDPPIEKPWERQQPQPNQPPAQKKPSQAEVLAAFRPRVESKIAEMEREMAQMEARHKARLEKIRASSVLRDAEQELRLIAADIIPSPLQSNNLHRQQQQQQQLDTNLDVTGASPVAASPAAASPAPTPQQPKRTIDEIAASVEAAVGKKIVSAPHVHAFTLTAAELDKMGIAPPEEPNTFTRQPVEAQDTGMTNGDDILGGNGSGDLHFSTTPGGGDMGVEEGTAAEMLEEFATRELDSNGEDVLGGGLDGNGVGGEGNGNGGNDENGGNEEGGMEDTIMADFVVDEESKAGTPAVVGGNGGEGLLEGDGNNMSGRNAEDMLDLNAGGEFGF